MGLGAQHRLAAHADLVSLLLIALAVLRIASTLSIVPAYLIRPIVNALADPPPNASAVVTRLGILLFVVAIWFGVSLLIPGLANGFMVGEEGVTLDIMPLMMAIADEGRRKDCRDLIELMSQATNEEPKMWGTSMVGFGSYHYKYASGHEGEAVLASGYILYYTSNVLHHYRTNQHVAAAIVLTAGPVSRILSWTGTAGNGDWDVGTTMNWQTNGT